MTLSRFWAVPIILVILFYAYIAHERLTICQLKVDKYQQQIDSLIQQSKAEESRVEMANRRAGEEFKRHQKESEAIMNMPVSKDCMGAIKWGIEQAAATLNSMRE